MTEKPPLPPAYVDYLLYDPETGLIHQTGRCMENMVDAQVRDGLRVRVHGKGDDIASYRIGAGGRLIRKSAAFIEAHTDIEIERTKALAVIDGHFARFLAPTPFADIHRAKLEQAEAGGGPLIADEQDRMSVLAKASERDAWLGGVESRRIAMKRRVRAAQTISKINEILTDIADV